MLWAERLAFALAGSAGTLFVEFVLLVLIVRSLHNLPHFRPPEVPGETRYEKLKAWVKRHRRRR